MAQKSLVNANDTIEIDISRFLNGAIQVTTGAGNSATAVFVVEFVGANSAAGTKEYITPISLTDPTTQSQVTALTGPSKSGWAECPGYSAVRVRRTDGTGGVGIVNIEHREG